MGEDNRRNFFAGGFRRGYLAFLTWKFILWIKTQVPDIFLRYFDYRSEILIDSAQFTISSLKESSRPARTHSSVRVDQ
jgi:hypothetical protein